MFGFGSTPAEPTPTGTNQTNSSPNPPILQCVTCSTLLSYPSLLNNLSEQAGKHPTCRVCGQRVTEEFGWNLLDPNDFKGLKLVVLEPASDQAEDEGDDDKERQLKLPLHAPRNKRFNDGCANLARGEYTLAEENFHRAYSSFRSTEGPLSGDCLDAGMNLGVVLRIVGRYEESEKYLKESYEGSRKVWGDQHVKTANCMQNLALLSEARGLHFDAKAIYDKCIALYTALLGPSHLSTLEARCNSLGNDFHLGEKFAATRGMEKVLQEKKEKLGEFNVSTLNAADNLACMYMKSHDKEDFKLAGELFKSVEDNLISRLGEEHFEVAKTRENMSIWYAKSGMLREAVEYKLKATVVYEKVMGEKCEKVQQMKHWMMTWENRMKFFQATGNKRAEKMNKH